jgi:hypothetical protein
VAFDQGLQSDEDGVDLAPRPKGGVTDAVVRQTAKVVSEGNERTVILRGLGRVLNGHGKPVSLEVDGGIEPIAPALGLASHGLEKTDFQSRRADHSVGEV